MYIKDISISNFKSIASAEIDFSRLALLIGANAAGKSNLINVFRFLADIENNGLDYAIALQGGISYLRNASMPKDEPITIKFSIDFPDEHWIRHVSSNIGLMINSVENEFSIKPNKKGNGYHIASDKLDVIYSINRVPKVKNQELEKVSDYRLTFERTTRKLAHKYLIYNCDSWDEKEKEKFESADISGKFFERMCREDMNELMLNKIALLLPPSFNASSFVRIFDFDPRELKKNSAMGSMKVLNENGSNIASVLQNILTKKANKEKFTCLVREFLPFVDSIRVENNFDKSFSYTVKESYSNKTFYSSFLSDGTVSLLAIVIALYFENNSNIVVLEEPERNIHPRLLKQLLSACKDVSSNKQIIITTHNPEFLKQAEIEDIRFIQRDCDGFTHISKPSDNPTVMTFIKNDLGLDDLFLKNLLGE